MTPSQAKSTYRPFAEVISKGCNSGQSSRSRTGSELETVHRVYRSAYNDLCAFAARMVDSRETAQDIVQHAFANTLAAIERGAKIQNASGYLNRSVRNLAIDYSKQKQVHEPIDDEQPHKSEKSIASSAELLEEWRAVTTAVEGLAPSQRRAFLLAELNGLDYEEIASRMNRSTDSVRMLLNRARRKVRAIAGSGRHLVGGFVSTFGPVKLEKPGLRGSLYRSQAWLRERLSELNLWATNLINQGVGSTLQPAVSFAASAFIVMAVSPLGSIEDTRSHPSNQQVASVMRTASSSVDVADLAIGKDRSIVDYPSQTDGDAQGGGEEPASANLENDAGANSSRSKRPKKEESVASTSQQELKIEPKDDPAGGIEYEDPGTAKMPIDSGPPADPSPPAGSGAKSERIPYRDSNSAIKEVIEVDVRTPAESEPPTGEEEVEKPEPAASASAGELREIRYRTLKSIL